MYTFEEEQNSFAIEMLKNKYFINIRDFKLLFHESSRQILFKANQLGVVEVRRHPSNILANQKRRGILNE